MLCVYLGWKGVRHFADRLVVVKNAGSTFLKFAELSRADCPDQRSHRTDAEHTDYGPNEDQCVCHLLILSLVRTWPESCSGRCNPYYSPETS